MPNVKILVVDDEERMRKLIGDFLKVRGYEDTEAGDGEEAVEKFFADKSISLILLDAENERLGCPENDPQGIETADHYAYRPRRGRG